MKRTIPYLQLIGFVSIVSLSGFFSIEGAILKEGDSLWNIITNDFIFAIDVSDKSGKFGSIRHIIPTDTIVKAIKNDLIAEDDEVLIIRAGPYFPFPGTIEVDGDTLLKLTSFYFASPDGKELPLEASMFFRIVDNQNLNIQYHFRANGTIDFVNGLSVAYKNKSTYWDSLYLYSHLGLSSAVALGGSERVEYAYLDHTIQFFNEQFFLSFVYSNPFHCLTEVWDRARGPELLWYILPYDNPRGPNDQPPPGPNLGSLLASGMELWREVNIEVGSSFSSCPQGFEVCFSPFPSGFDQIIMMMFDQIPFQGQGGVPGLWIFPKSGHDPDALIGQFMVRLLEEHPKMKQCWLFLPDDIMREDDILNPEENRWWRVHSKDKRVLANAPTEYHAWLRRLEQDSVVFGYEDRVRLGNHGYHHTPSHEYGKNWEFQYYDPIGHDSTFYVIREDYYGIGLTDRSLRIFRAPGFRTTRSTLNALIKYGFKFYDRWCVDGRYVCPKVNVFYSPLGRLWGLESTWQGDTPNPYEVMHDVLARGKCCLTAGHPPNWFTPGYETAYTEIDQIFDMAERDFPHLGYLFPDEYAEYMDETHLIRNITSRFDPEKGVTITFEGTCSKGQTIIVGFDPIKTGSFDTNITIDGGQRVEGEIRGVDKFGEATWLRMYLVLPSLTAGMHHIRVPLAQIRRQVPSVQCYPNPSRGFFRVAAQSNSHTALIQIFNPLGQKLFEKELYQSLPGTRQLSWTSSEMASLPAGVYFVKVVLDKGRELAKVIVLK